MASKKLLTFFIDVDDTFVRSHGSKHIPIPATIKLLKIPYEQGAELYCWSSGGADYARNSAIEFGIENIFTAFLPKPQVIIDDVKINDWRNLMQVHPNMFPSKQLGDYIKELEKYNSR